MVYLDICRPVLLKLLERIEKQSDAMKSPLGQAPPTYDDLHRLTQDTLVWCERHTRLIFRIFVGKSRRNLADGSWMCDLS